jgi:hypothetical protein
VDLAGGALPILEEQTQDGADARGVPRKSPQPDAQPWMSAHIVEEPGGGPVLADH